MPEKGQIQESYDEIFAEILNLLEGKLAGLSRPFGHEATRLERRRPIAIFVKAIMAQSIADLFAMGWDTYFAPQARTLRRI
jgi:hypothetical protein